MEVKKIGTLPVQDAASDATYVLIEEGGAAKRIPAANLAPEVKLPDPVAAVQYDAPQELTPEQQEQARANIGFEEAVLRMMAAAGVTTPVTDESSALYTDENNKIYLI